MARSNTSVSPASALSRSSLRANTENGVPERPATSWPWCSARSKVAFWSRKSCATEPPAAPGLVVGLDRNRCVSGDTERSGFVGRIERAGLADLDANSKRLSTRCRPMPPTQHRAGTDRRPPNQPRDQQRARDRRREHVDVIGIRVRADVARRAHGHRRWRSDLLAACEAQRRAHSDRCGEEECDVSRQLHPHPPPAAASPPTAPSCTART